jgi:hypothetical protein
MVLMKTDRRKVMLDAHRRFADGKRLNLGWTFAQCLRTAWAAERIRRDRRIIVTQWERRSMWRCHKPIWDLRHAA